MTDAALQGRIDTVRRQLSLAGVIEQTVKLGGRAGAKDRRGPCPFHAGKSASFSVNVPARYAHCFGCGWHGDVIRFVQDQFGLAFIDALKDCEARAGIAEGPVRDAGQRNPILRERNPTPSRRAREKVLIETIDMARVLWRRSRPDHTAVRRYFTGRGVPEWVMPDQRLAQFRYLSACPLMPWELRGPDDARAWPRDALIAPAVLAMVRRPQWLESPAGPVLEFVPVGLHVTYLNPDGTGTMIRRRPWAKADDDDPLFPKRKMLGPVGHGAVLLGEWSAQQPVYVGEGNETVLSGMALADAPSHAVGLAVLSLDNLQGGAKKYAGGIWPLFRIAPDPARPCFTVPGQQGPVTVLIDSDMAPLGRQKLIAAKGAGITERALTGAERATICAELAVQGWRASGAHDVRALRAPLGMDFNDAIQGEAA